jgi:beta-barrel assembly-enhancing protease
MKKIVGEFLVLAGLFFSTWFLLRTIDYRSLFRVDEVTNEAEQKLSELILDQMKKDGAECASDTVLALVDSIRQRLWSANGIADSSITIHILVHDEVNAVALPNRQLVVYTGIIKYCNSAEELAGVLAHEITHIRHGHVMKKLKREVGMSMLGALAGGDAGGDIVRQTTKLLTSSAFDREMESDADNGAVHLLAKAGIDPVHFADILFRLSQEKGNVAKRFEWISSHPNTQERCAQILKLRKQETYSVRPILTNEQWAFVQKTLRTIKTDDR